MTRSHRRTGPDRQFWTLVAILLLAALLRLPGTLWELPGPDHQYSYHPDELPILGAASKLEPLHGQLNPYFYNYGTLQIYLLWFPMQLGETPRGFSYGFAVLVCRLVTAAMGVVTVALCWAAGRRLAGPAGGAVAALFVAVAPLHVQHSQFVTVDVPSALWVAAALLMSVSGRPVAGGFLAGLAAATKYTTGAVLVAPLTVALMEPPGRRWRQAALTCAAAAGAFLLGCPGVILYPRYFLKDFLFEVQHARTGHGLVFLETGPGWLYHILHSLLPGLGWPLLALTAVAVYLAIRSGDRRLRPVLVFAGVFFLILSLGQVRFARYTIPLIPAFAMLAGATAPALPVRLRLTGAALALGGVHAALLSLAFIWPDPRTEAAYWIRQNIPRGSSVGLVSPPWFYTPPLSREFGRLRESMRIRAAEEVEDYRVLIARPDWSTTLLDKKPEVVIISSYESFDRERLKDADYRRFMERLAKEYARAVEFGGDPPVRLFSVVAHLPHDMQYPSPRIIIYERKSAARRGA